MKKISIELQDCHAFSGGWGIAPYEVYFSIKHLEYEEKLRILEFGSGQGTTNLVNLLVDKKIDFEYFSIENDINYAKTPLVKYQLYEIADNYDLNDLSKIDLDLIGYYDLVIVDGPHGVGRCKWYSKFKNNVREGSIILVDDFHHYKEFSTELDAHFEYDVINFFNTSRRFTDTDINYGIEQVDMNSNLISDKSYKIVKITKIK